MVNLILWLVAIWFGTHYAFVTVIQAKGMRERGTLTGYWKIYLVPLAIVGVAFDALFNLIFGSIIFRELPNEWLFSERVQDKLKYGQGSDLKAAQRWQKRLNAVDPGHIRDASTY